MQSVHLFIVIFDTALNFEIAITKPISMDTILNHDVATIALVVNREHTDRYKKYYKQCNCSFTRARVILADVALRGYHYIGIQVHIFGNRYLKENLSRYLIFFKNCRVTEVNAHYPFVIAQVEKFDLNVVLHNVTVTNSTAVKGKCVVFEGVTYPVI